MWLHDPYVIDEWLRAHAEQTARLYRPAVGDRIGLPARAALALRVLVDAALAARVGDAVAAATPAVPPQPAHPTRA